MWFQIHGRTLERLAPGILLILPLLMGGCRSVGYYTQAVKGHCQIVARQTSCAALLSDTNTPPELRAKLQLARELCTFAEHKLGLPAHGAYQRYADLSRPFVVWNVYAAPAFSLEAKTWWYPFVGSLDYRGYFTENGARKCADLLEARGFDVYVEGVEA
jgi:predicted aminopeptidase